MSSEMLDISNGEQSNLTNGEEMVNGGEMAKMSENKSLGAGDSADNVATTIPNGETPPSTDDAKKEDTGVKESEVDGTKDGWMDVVGNEHIMKKIIRKGEGPNYRPERGSVVVINYTQKHSEEEPLVIEEKKDFTFSIGDAEVIQGLDIVLTLMEKGEIAEIQISPRFGYGEVGRLPEIMPNARLFYVVELVDVLPPVDEEMLTMEQRLTIGSEKRHKGNWWYSRGDYAQAIQCYRRSLDYLDDGEAAFNGSDIQLQQALDERLKVYNNLTASQLKLEAHEAALMSVEHVLRLQPDNVKALFRKGKILGFKKQTTEAIQCLRRALKLEPDTKVIQQELAKLLDKQKNEVQSEKALYKRMLGTNKETGANGGPKPKKGVRGWSYLLGSIAVVIIGIFTYRHFYTSTY